MSRDAVDEAPDDVREEYQIIETERAEWEAKEKEALKTGRPLEGSSPIDPRSLDELQAEMDTQRANLEMNLSTNPGVVEQYEKRKRDVRRISLIISEHLKLTHICDRLRYLKILLLKGRRKRKESPGISKTPE